MEPVLHSRQAREKSLGIGARMALVVGGAVTLINIVGGIWIYRNLNEALVREAMSRQEAAADSLAPQFIVGLRTAWDDAVFLTGVPSIGGIMRARQAGGYDRLGTSTDQQWRNRLTVIFTETLRAHRDYLQVRLIGVADNGREVVRVERNGADIAVIPESGLQQKGDRGYFHETCALLAGEVYLSPIELNEEWGRVVEPHVPVVRAASPIYESEGQVFGIIIINIDLRRRFLEIRKSLPSRYSLYLFDQAGEFLLHPDPDATFGLQLGKQPFGLEDEFPGLLAKSAGRDVHAAVTESVNTGPVVASMRKLYADPGNPERWWGLLLTSEYGDVTAASASQRNEFIVFACLLLAVTLGTIVLVSRHLTWPLRRITQAVEAFAKGGSTVALPVNARDEAGVLAVGFRNLFVQIRNHEEEMRTEAAERRRAEHALRRSEQRLQLALAAAEAGVWAWDQATDNVHWDRSMEKLFGVVEGAFDGTLASWSRLIHPGDWQELEAAFRLSMDADHPFSLELKAKKQGGGWKYLKLHGAAAMDNGGHHSRFIGVCWDISDEKLAQQRVEQYAQQLEQTNQEMEQFVYSISHDLKAPLVTCKGFLGVLREDLSDGKTEQALQSVQRLERASRQMTRLIEDLLQFSRVGRGTDQRETIELAKLVGELAEDLREQNRASHVRIDIQEDMPNLIADPTAISRLFQNLIANAFKYGMGGPQARLEIGGGVDAGEIRFFVRDNGPGIPKQYQRKIFQLFQRLDTAQEGTGIGLAVVTKIMSTYGGRVWLESDSGQGATFWLAFPLSFLAPAPAALTRSLA